MNEKTKVVGYAAAAEIYGVAPKTMQAYVSRGQAPPPDLPHTVEAGKARPTWRRKTLERAAANRPGRGSPGIPRKAA